MTQKFYARQIAPEYQESPFWETYTQSDSGLILTGNGLLSEFIPDKYVPVFEWYEDAAQEMESLEDGNPANFYNTVPELIQGFFPAGKYRDADSYTSDDLEQIRAALRLYQSRAYWEGQHFAAMLDALTGHEWRYVELHGCCQSEWQGCYYDSTMWRQEGLWELEAEYFNTGEEWIIHDDDTEPSSPEDITGCSVYITGDDSRAELAEIIGCDPEELKLYHFRGWTRRAEYEED